jgi:anti-sigma factor RsiW
MMSCSECSAGTKSYAADVRGASVSAHDAARVDRETAPAGFCSADVVDRLVVRALQERANRSRRPGFMPSHASPAANVTACCSAMPTSKVASRILLRKAHEPEPFAHRRRDRDEALVACRHVAHPIAEDLRIGGFADGLGVRPTAGSNFVTP